ncbi:VOC family protein [Sphingomonas sanguinis]|uniref:VOC family protein n=1 Tax=Sphingomonas sanguinis TaxID=33051 RepID=UPI001C560599|nr:VOC family protein [Sphingomonas sanguinis]QXT34565.1 VOC family protein [Sphingomonas sanguinis]
MRHEIIPSLRYADAPRAIEFLCTAFGFARHMVVADPDDPGIIHHAQLLWQDRMVMVSSALDTPHCAATGLKTPAQAGGTTLGLYLVVEDVDGHAEQARAAGAIILIEPEDKPYGGRDYTARDPEGYVWSFGSYDPWA